jgi:tape measure domain-containing protein
MASKTVQPIAIELGIKGGEKLAALNGSFRDLSKQTKLSDKDIVQATQDIVKFAKEVGNSEATIKGQIKAFEGLRAQANLTGAAYKDIGKGIVELKASLDGISAKSQAQAKRLAEIGTSAKSSVSQIKDAIEKLKLLSKEARTGSDAFARLKGNIADMGEALEVAEGKAKKQREISNLLNGTLRKSSTLIGLQSKAYRERVAITEKEIQAIDLLSGKERSTVANTEKRVRLEGKLQNQLLMVAQTGYLEFIASSRSETIKLAEAFNSTDASINSFRTRLKALDADFGKLPNTTKGLNQRLAELNIELNNTVRSSSDYTRVSNEIIGIQKELSKETGESAQAFERLNRAQEGAERRAAKLAGMGEYVASVSGLGSKAAADRIARGGTPVIGQMRSREGFPQGYRDPASGAMIAPGVGTRQSQRLFDQTYKTKEETQKLAAEQKNLEAVFDSVIDSYRQGLEKIQQHQQKRHDDLMSQVAEEDAAQQESFNKQVQREENAFQQELKRRDILLQARKSAESALGLGGRDDISSLYQGIIGLSTADIRRQQQMMGKSATDVFNDIATGFNKGGQAVDLKGKSTDIGDSIAGGVSKGASSSNEISKGAKSFAEKLINAYKAAFGIKSPSKRTEQEIGIPLGLGIIRGLLSALKSGKKEVQREIESIADPAINKSRQPRRLIGTVNEPIATFTGYGTKSRAADQGYRPLGKSPVNLNSEIDRMFDRFRASIAALTTDAEIYYNLLQRLPTSRITTTLADLANKRSAALQVSGFMDTQRQIGPGDLEREIASSVAGYLKDLRTPNPWFGITGDYKAFINSISTETRRLRNNIPALPPSKVAGLLPPAAGLTPAQQARASAAYGRSDERSRSVLEEDASRRSGQPLFLPSGAGGPAKTAAASAGNSFKELNTTLLEFGRLSDRSTADVRELAASLGMLGDTLSPLDADFKKVNGAIADQTRLIENELQKRSRTRRKFSPGKAAQVAGATISGGIFGGPEGFLGGAIGGAVGDVGGAFAGAALGAQVGQLRQTLGDFAEYAAGITKLKIALKGITDDAYSYRQALQAAADVTKELNVPQEVAIKGITRLTAAVKGAGGGVADAELAFKNITAAITATGGGAEQVEGAVTALVQIFSKGKVSAEEINQIAERLPGTFNKIAEASGRTGPELSKALQSGEVGLNDLMKFLVQLGGEYGELAKKIAGSSESAGARLTVAYNNMRIEIGKALQPIGAEFQEAFLEFITDIGPALVRTAKAVGEGFRFIIQNRNAIGTLAFFAAKLVAVNFALKAFVAFNGPLRLMFALIRTGFRQTTQEASLAATNLARFGKTVKALAASLAAPIVITFAIIGAELVISYFNRIKQAKADLDASGTKPQGEVFFRSIGGTAATKETLRSNFKDINKNMELLRQRIKKSEEALAKARETRGVDPAVNPGAGMAPVAGFALPEREDLTTQIKADKAELARNELNFRTLIDKYPYAPDAAKPLTVYDDPTGTDGGKGKGKGKGRADQTLSRLISLQNEYDSIIRSSPLLEIQRVQVGNSLALVQAQEDNNAELINTIKNNEINLDFADQELQITNQYIDAMNAANSIENPQERLLAERIAKEKQAFELEKLLISANGEKLALAQDTAIAAERIAKASEVELFNLRDQLGLVGKQERIVRFSQSRIDARDPNAEQQTDLYRQTIDPTLTEGLSQNIRSLKEELEELVNPINQITGAANAIGGAFSQSFTDAISGSKSAKEALADFFKSVGSYFLDMAGQIIAKMVTIAILNAVTGLLPGGGAINSKSLGAIQNYSGVGANTDVSGLAVGLRANGGPVSANTPYIVGERGPELFVPFQQGNITSNEELEAQMRDTRSANMAFSSSSSSFQQLQSVNLPFTRNAEQSSIVAAERETAQAISNPAPLNVRFESQVINGVEYVTAEQHRQGMAQAAERGRSLTLSALQGSVKTRKKVGLS